MVDYVNKYNDLVYTVASLKHKEFPMIPKDDIVQEAWMWFVTHPKKTEEWDGLEDKDSIKLFAKALHNAVRKYCISEKAKIAGYEPDDLFYYRRDIVEELLPSVLNGDLQTSNNIDYNDKVKGASSPSEGGNLLAMQSDVSRAFSMLKEEQQNILYLWNETKRNSKELGRLINANEKTARMKVLRAIDAIVKKLGGRPPYPDKDYK